MLGSQNVTIYLEKDKILKREISTEDQDNYKNKDLMVNKEFQICKTATALPTGELNIYDAFEDTRFNREVDLLCGRMRRSVLTSTFLRENNSIGVVQVCNKINGDCFIRIDAFILKLFKKHLSVWSFIEDVGSLKKFNEVLNYDVFLPILTYQFDRGLNLIEDERFEYVEIPSSFFKFQEETDYSQYPEKLLNLMTYSFISVCDLFNDNKKALRTFLYMVRRCYWETPENRFEYAFENFKIITCIAKNYPNLYNKWEVCVFFLFNFCIFQFTLFFRKLHY